MPRIYAVLGVENAPVGRRAAVDAIAVHLTNERKREIVSPAMKALREAAQLQYLGSFARPAGTVASASPVP